MAEVFGDALGELIDRIGPALLLYARQWCHCADDIVQEAFVDYACQTKGKAVGRTGIDNPTSWLFAVVRHKAKTAARSEARRRRHEEIAARERPRWFLTQSDEDEDQKQLVAALARRPIDEREIIVLHIWGRLTFHEIGKLVGLSASTAHRRYLAGLAAIKEEILGSCRTTLSSSTSKIG